MYQLTQYTADRKFIESTKNNIERSFPGVTQVNKKGSESALFITDAYWNFCQDYVQRKCKIKSE